MWWNVVDIFYVICCIMMNIFQLHKTWLFFIRVVFLLLFFQSLCLFCFWVLHFPQIHWQTLAEETKKYEQHCRFIAENIWVGFNREIYLQNQNSAKLAKFKIEKKKRKRQNSLSYHSIYCITRKFKWFLRACELSFYISISVCMVLCIWICCQSNMIHSTVCQLISNYMVSFDIIFDMK